MIDDWLRSGLLVDLLPVVTHAIVLGEPSYSIKKVEALYMEARTAEGTTAGDSVVAYIHWQASGEPARAGPLPQGSPQLQAIEDYNREDCRSTVFLHDWLLGLRDAHAQDFPTAAATLLTELPESLQSDPPPDAEPSTLTAQEETGPRGMSWRVQRLLAQLLPFHHCEMKVAWWAYFDRREQALVAPAELEDDGEAIAGALLQPVESRPSARTGADLHTLAFDPAQPLKLNVRSDQQLRLEIPQTGLRLDVDTLDEEQGLVTLKYPWSKRDQRRAEGLPDGIPRDTTSLIRVPVDIARTLRDSRLEQAEGWIDRGRPLPEAMRLLMERRPVDGLRTLQQSVDAEPRAVAALLADFLRTAPACAMALQGPPGTGKTTVTAELIARLVEEAEQINRLCRILQAGE